MQFNTNFIYVTKIKAHRDQSFADVPITDDGIETAQFLEASDGLVNMFGTFLNFYELFRSGNIKFTYIFTSSDY